MEMAVPGYWTERTRTEMKIIILRSGQRIGLPERLGYQTGVRDRGRTDGRTSPRLGNRSKHFIAASCFSDCVS